MGLFRRTRKRSTSAVKRPAVWAIDEKTLDLIGEASAGSYPNEFGGILKTNEDGIISEVMLLPGTLSGGTSAIFQLHMLPIDFMVVGTVHSHPSGNYHPSGADLALFEKFGRIHIIMGYPYNRSTWQAYDFKGDAIELEIVQ